MTRKELLAAKAKGHTHAVSRDSVSIGKITRKFISTHRSEAEAIKALRTSKGNAVYSLNDLPDES